MEEEIWRFGVMDRWRILLPLEYVEWKWTGDFDMREREREREKRALDNETGTEDWTLMSVCVCKIVFTFLNLAP